MFLGTESTEKLLSFVLHLLECVLGKRCVMRSTGTKPRI